MARLAKVLIPFTFLTAMAVQAQDLPDDELQVNLNTYFDSFNVQVVYPSLSLTKRMSESSSFNVRYLVDLVTAASIRGNVHADSAIVTQKSEDDGGEGVDGVTSASQHSEGYRPDDVRQQVGGGMSQVFAGGVVSFNGLYSKEFDYRSSTLAGTYTRSFLKNNTTLQFGFVRSWDANSPKIFKWTRHKNESSYSSTLSQVWTKRLITQAIFSYDLSTGLLSDPYEVVTINQGGRLSLVTPVHPDRRVRKAVGLRANYMLDRRTALHVGLRYYWDDWDVRSLTSSLSWDKHVTDHSTISLGFRNYVQGRAFFFKEHYQRSDALLAVDSKLDRGYSNQVEFKLSLQGGDHYGETPLLMNERVQFNMLVALYHRHTATPNWFTKRRNLISLLMSFGIRYRF